MFILHLLDVFLVVLLDVLKELFALEDFDVGGEADDEAAGAFDAVDGGVEDPFAIYALEFLLSQREFLQEEILGAGVKLQGDVLDLGANHPEDIRLLDFMFVLESPVGVGDLNLVDTHHFEDAAVLVLDIVSPDVNHVGREGERFHQVVLGLIAVSRLIALQDYLFLVLDGIHQGLHVDSVGGIVDVVGDAGAVIDTDQLPLQVTLESVVVVDALNHLGRQVSLLLGEVDELIEVRQAPGHLAHGVHIAVELVHHKPCLTDSVDVPINCTCSDAHLLCKRIYCPGNIPR